MKKPISICLGLQKPTDIPATEKQARFIFDLLSKKKILTLSNEDCKKFTKKVASKLIDCLLTNKQFTIWDYEKVRELKVLRKQHQDDVKLKRYIAKQEERRKFAEIKSQVVKPITLSKTIPRTFDRVQPMSFEMQQAKLRELEDN